jgi:hypothetical protein
MARPVKAREHSDFPVGYERLMSSAMDRERGHAGNSGMARRMIDICKDHKEKTGRYTEGYRRISRSPLIVRPQLRRHRIHGVTDTANATAPSQFPRRCYIAL